MIFGKKPNVKKILNKVGTFCIVEVTDFGHRLGVNTLKISTFHNGSKIGEEMFTNELYEEKIRKHTPVIFAETIPEEYEGPPITKLVLGRLELPRIGLMEEL